MTRRTIGTLVGVQRLCERDLVEGAVRGEAHARGSLVERGGAHAGQVRAASEALVSSFVKLGGVSVCAH